MNKFDKYLTELLGVEKKELLDKALGENKVIIISGVQQSGKTTLMRTLREFGYTAVEDFDIHEIKLTNPLKHKIVDYDPMLVQEKKSCPCCGALSPEYFYLNNEDGECVGCTECMSKTNVLF